MKYFSSGHTLLKLLTLVVVIALIMGALYYILIEARHTVACRENLRRIYHALEIHDMSYGALPRLEFFSNQPLSDPESICVALEAYGLPAEVWTCPASPPVLKAGGLTYLWNTELNGRSLRSIRERTWMMMDMQALSDDVARPHIGYCNVLFTDGTIERIANPASELKLP
jgi:prepilin-type processing-associated H-X9-DG protein